MIHEFLVVEDAFLQLLYLGFYSSLIIVIWEILALIYPKHKISIGLAALACDYSELRLFGLICLLRALRDIVIYRVDLFLKNKIKPTDTMSNDEPQA